METQNFTTIPGMLQAVLNKYRNSCALNSKRLGHWERVSTEELVEQVRRLSLGLRDIGVEPGTKFGIIVPPSPQWLMIDLAVMVNGAVSVPMFPNISSDNFAFEVSDSSMKYLFLKNANLLEEAVRDKLKDFKKVVSLDVETMGENVINFDELLARGDEVSSRSPELFCELQNSIKEDDLATIIYTSGATGVPKGAEITHRNLVSQIHAATERFPLDPAQDKVLSCLPLAHVFERMVMYFYLSTGTSVYFADDIKKVGDLLRELRPTVLTLVPRLLEKVYAKMLGRLDEQKGPKKKLAQSAFARARKIPPGKGGLLSKIHNKLVYSKLRDAMGGNLRLVICGSAKLNVDIERFFVNIGLPLHQGYGLTECSPVVAANFPGHSKLGTVGLPFPGVSVKTSLQGEILVRGPNVFRGYHNSPKETREMIEDDGWLHTGDLGSIDEEGYVKITGRKKELFKTSNGKYVSPTPIEQEAAQNELVDMATVIAEGRKFVSMLLFPDYENLDGIRAARGYGDMTNQDFLSSPEVSDELDKMVETINAHLNHWEQIKKCRLVQQPISIASGELTPTMKIRRHVVEKKFSKIIEEIYAD